MGIDLGLERLQLTLALFFLFMDILLHQFPDPVGHHIEGSGKASDLIFRKHFYIRRLKISLLDLRHGIPQALDRQCDIAGDKAGDQKGNDDQDDGRHKVNAPGLVAGPQQFFYIDAAHYCPAGLL